MRIPETIGVLRNVRRILPLVHGLSVRLAAEIVRENAGISKHQVLQMLGDMLRTRVFGRNIPENTLECFESKIIRVAVDPQTTLIEMLLELLHVKQLLKPTPQPHTLRWGVEIETAEANSSFVSAVKQEFDPTNQWGQVWDTSCGPELISPILEGTKPIFQVMAILDLLYNKVQYNNKCSLHMHFNAAMHNISLRYLHRRLKDLEPIFYWFVGPERWPAAKEYAEPVTKVINPFEDRYKGVNYCAMDRHGTIEFRYGVPYLDPTRFGVLWGLYFRVLSTTPYKNGVYHTLGEALQAIAGPLTKLIILQLEDYYGKGGTSQILKNPVGVMPWETPLGSTLDNNQWRLPNLRNIVVPEGTTIISGFTGEILTRLGKFLVRSCPECQRQVKIIKVIAGVTTDAITEKHVCHSRCHGA